MKRVLIVSTIAALLAIAAPVSAQMTGTPSPGYRTGVGQPASAIPAPLRQLAFDQRIGDQAPLDVTLRDESGRPRALGSYMGGKPVVLAFVYYECPMLCTQVLRGLSSTIKVFFSCKYSFNTSMGSFPCCS